MVKKNKTYTAAMSRFMEAKRKKTEIIKELETLIKAEYEQETGLKADYFFAM